MSRSAALLTLLALLCASCAEDVTFEFEPLKSNIDDRYPPQLCARGAEAEVIAKWRVESWAPATEVAFGYPNGATVTYRMTPVRVSALEVRKGAFTGEPSDVWFAGEVTDEGRTRAGPLALKGDTVTAWGALKQFDGKALMIWGSWWIVMPNTAASADTPGVTRVRMESELLTDLLTPCPRP